jgi:DNA-binding NtrC family response regulator
MTETPGRVLVVDDDPAMQELLRDELQERGYQVTAVGDGYTAMRILGEEEYDVVLTDLRLRGMQGLELLNDVKRSFSDTNVIILTAFGTVETAIEAMKHGAYDYVMKPIKGDELVLTIGKAVRDARLRREVQQLRRAVREEYSFHQILGKSKVMREVFDLIRRVAGSQANVLITGESGTGKELVAKAIHFNSDRRDGPFVPVNCAAIPDTLLESELFGHIRGAFTDARGDKRGLFEEAHGGTLFLDEISELPIMLQPKLLRAIQEKEIRRVGSTKAIAVDVRIIAATNRALAEEVKAKRFREDLYYRLNVIEIRMPPLRERREDIPLLVDAFIKKFAMASQKAVTGVTEEALSLLMDYPWPGNVRELENAVERAVTLARGDKVRPEDLPPAVLSGRGDKPALEEAVEKTLPLEAVEQEYILRILDKTGGNKCQAAQILGIDRKTLYRKLSEIAAKRAGR